MQVSANIVWENAVSLGLSEEGTQRFLQENVKTLKYYFAPNHPPLRVSDRRLMFIFKSY